MQMLTITEDELKRHKQYFYANAVPALKSLQAEVEREWNARPTKTLKWQKEYLCLCLKRSKQLAVGTPEQLRRIQEELEKKGMGYSIYARVIEKDAKFQSLLEKAFGYDAFCDTPVGQTMVEGAKHRAEIKSGTTYTRYDHVEILEEIERELNSLDPELKKNFQDKLNRIKGKRTKKKLVSLLGEVLIAGIEEGRISACSLPDWNPYLLQYNRGIRTCPYCNRQYITPLYKEGGKARADLDHFYPKSKYPHFALSIFNLIPCCKVCNSSFKGAKEFDIKRDKTPYELSLDDLAEFQYDPFHSPRVRFREKSSAAGATASYTEIFQLEEVYRCHENIAEEILEQSRRYSALWIRDMLDSGLVGSKKELYQLLLGKISDRDRILDEPLSKLKRDLVREIWGEDALENLTR